MYMSPTLSSRPRSWYVRLAALPSAVPVARRALRLMLGEWQLEGVSDTALLLVSELVTNAVMASERVASPNQRNRQMIALNLELTDACLLTEVWDASPAVPVLQEADLAADHGRGLQLVDFLGDAWGYRAADGGKVVWCEIAIPA